MENSTRFSERITLRIISGISGDKAMSPHNNGNSQHRNKLQPTGFDTALSERERAYAT